MKSNELTDGIYVYFNCFDGSKIIVKVTGFKDGVVYGVSEMGSHWCTIEKVEPIPLTPEILEKNGIFKHKFEGHLEECYSTSANPISNEQFILWKETDRFELVLRHIVDNLTYSALRCKVRYVHELQHALRVCGIEKEIEL